ncbi:MAG: sigma-70 family RNA polymerase sigma factor [Planctomycetota bacterium]
MDPLDPETILAQDDWLRRIARQLVRDPEQAEDLVQEAWLAALRRGRTDDRGWLFGVLRNRTRATNRTEARQRDRALRSPRRADAPAADEVVEDLQLRARVAEELVQVEEPYRTALYLRFVVGVPEREGARSTGVARSTFGDRVHRGLALLRKRLDDAHDGDRRAWAAPLLPLAGTGGPIATVAAWILMSTTTKTVAAIGLSAALLLLAARLAEGTGTARTSAAPADAGDDIAALPEPLAAVEKPVAARSTSSASPTPRTGDPPGASASARLVARVVRGDGAPAAGTLWTLRGRLRSDEEPSGTSVPLELEGELGEDGALEIAFEPPLAQRFRLTLEAPECAPESWSWKSVEPREVLDLGTVELLRAGSIVGRLVDEQGRAIDGGTWSLRARTLTNSVDERRSGGYLGFVAGDGAFVIDRVPPGPARLEFTRDRRAIFDSVTVDVKSGGTHEVEICIEDRPAAQGRVSVTLDDSTGLPKPDVDADRIALIDGQGRRSDATAGLLTWIAAFEDVDGGPFTLVIDDPRFLPWSREGVVGGDAVRAEVRGSASIELRLTGQSSDTEEDPYVEVESLDRHGSKLTKPMPGGSYTLEHVVPGDYRMKITGTAGSTSVDVLGVRPSERRVVEIALGGDIAVTGRAVHPGGAPVVGRNVRLVRPARIHDAPDATIAMNRAPYTDIDHLRIEIDATRTAEDGRFTLVAPDAGRYLVVLGDRDDLRAETAPFDLASDEAREPIELVAPASARLRGTLEAPADLDFTGWVLMAHDPRAGPRAVRAGERCKLRADRSFLFGDLEPGPREIYLASPTNAYLVADDGRPLHGRLLADVTLEGGEDVPLDLTLADPEPAVVTFEIDAPLPDGASVTITLRDGRELGLGGHASGALPRVGPVTVDAATYVDVQVRGEDWAFASEEPVVLAPGARTTVPLRIPLVSGAVRLDGPDGPLRKKYVEVAVEGASGIGASFGRTTDDEGRVELRLAPGRYLVSRPTAKTGGERTWTRLEWRTTAPPKVLRLSSD